MLFEMGTGQLFFCNIAMYGAASFEGSVGCLKLRGPDAPCRGKLTESLPAEIEGNVALLIAEAGPEELADGILIV